MDRIDRETLVFRPKLDKRDSVMKTHDGREWTDFVYVDTLSEIVQSLRSMDVNCDMHEVTDDIRCDEERAMRSIVIDEVQFFFGVTDDELRGLQKLSITHNIICAGLDTSFKFVPFETTAKIMCIADHVVKLTSQCVECGSSSQLTSLRDADCQLSTYVLGAGERYSPVCRECAFKA